MRLKMAWKMGPKTKASLRKAGIELWGFLREDSPNSLTRLISLMGACGGLYMVVIIPWVFDNGIVDYTYAGLAAALLGIAGLTKVSSKKNETVLRPAAPAEQESQQRKEQDYEEDAVH